MNLLIVDDEPLEHEQLAFLVRKQYPDWHIYTAEDVVEAKQLIKETNFPLAFVDIQLPGESGLDFCDYLQKNNYDTDVILVTAHQDFAYAKQAIRLDVADYLVKPVIEKEFYQVIENFLTKHAFVDTKSALINNVLDIIRKDYHEKLLLPDIAKRVYVSPTYLSKKFTDEVGVKFTEYINQFRIQKAKQRMIENPEWSLSQVAESVGFSSQHHFSNLFRKTEGITPSKFKENQS